MNTIFLQWQKKINITKWTYKNLNSCVKAAMTICSVYKARYWPNFCYDIYLWNIKLLDSTFGNLSTTEKIIPQYFMVYCKSLRNIPMFILRKLCKYMCRKHSSLKINVYKFKDTYKVSFSRHFSECIFCYMRIQIQENEFRNVQYFFYSTWNF